MGLIAMALLCCASFFILLIPSASSLTLDQSSSLKATDAARSPGLVLARKFKMLEEERRVSVKVEAHGFQVLKQKDNHKENASEQPNIKEQSGMKGRKWMKVADDMSSRFFTMDYAHLERRRPVHNMSFKRP